MKDGKISKPAFALPLNETVSMNENPLEISPVLKELFASQGLGWKWLNAKQVSDRQGRHKNGYTVLKLDRTDPDQAEIIKKLGLMGVSPEGTVIYRDLILGYKTLEGIAQHRKSLDNKVKSQLEAQKGAVKQRNQEMVKAGITIKDDDF